MKLGPCENENFITRRNLEQVGLTYDWKIAYSRIFFGAINDMQRVYNDPLFRMCRNCNGVSTKVDIIHRSIKPLNLQDAYTYIYIYFNF